MLIKGYPSVITRYYKNRGFMFQGSGFRFVHIAGDPGQAEIGSGVFGGSPYHCFPIEAQVDKARH